MDGYPKHAAQVRDLIVDLLKSQADHGKAMDTGGGMEQADLWVWIDAVLGSKRTNRQSIADQFGDKTPQPDQCLVLYENENVFWQNTEWLDFCRWLAPIGSSHRA